MKKSNTALLVGIGMLAIGGTGLGATASATNGYAKSGGYGKIDSSWNWQWKQNRDDNFDTKLSAAIAERYNVDTAEVASLVETVRDDQFKVLNDKRQAVLDDALENEKITQEQYDTIIGHFNEIDATYDKMDDVSASERSELWKEIKSEFKDLTNYMKDENISVELGLEAKYRHHDQSDKGRHSNR